MTTKWEILVVGAGPAGIAAAVCAAEQGKSVCIVDDNPNIGGQIWRGEHGNTLASAWYGRLDAASVVRLSGWRIFAQPGPGMLRAEKSGKHVDLAYGKLILATGARELFLPFPGWTLPNVVGAGALQALVKSGLPIADKRVAIAGSGPLLLAVAAYLKRRGARIVALCEQATLSRLLRFATSIVSNKEKLQQAIRLSGPIFAVPLRTGCWPIAANGQDKVTSVTFRKGTRTWTVGCDYFACGFHLVPNTELAELLGCLIRQGKLVVDDMQQTSVADIYCAGEPTGVGGLEAALVDGRIAGYSSAGNLEKAGALFAQRESNRRFTSTMADTFRLHPALRELAAPDTTICRCEDVPLQALLEYGSWRAAKLHTRCGMGPCQGRVCGPVSKFLLGWTPDSVRPPIFPATISSLSAPTIQPEQDTALKEN